MEKMGSSHGTLEFIFFDGEEAMVQWTDTDSIYGARHLAQKWADTMIIDASGTPYSRITQIDVMILLDLLGTKEVTIHNSQGASQWIWDRLCRIHERLGVLKLLSPHMLNRIKKGDYMFRSGSPVIASHAMQVSRRIN